MTSGTAALRWPLLLHHLTGLRQADYVLAVKGNQERLHTSIQEAFAKLDAAPTALPHFASESKEAGHGRQEIRRVTSLDALQHVPEDILFEWAKLESITRVQAEIVKHMKGDPRWTRRKV